MQRFNADALASRVAGLMQARFHGDLAAAARALEVPPDDLRKIVETESNQPSLDVLAAIVKHFGIDACWLLTGDYNWRAHMSALHDDESGTDATRGTLLRLIGG